MLVLPLIPQFLRLVSFKFVATLARAAAMPSMHAAELEVMAAKKGRQQKLEQQEVERGAAVNGRGSGSCGGLALFAAALGCATVPLL